jgi:hypothetical protein
LVNFLRLPESVTVHKKAFAASKYLFKIAI